MLGAAMTESPPVKMARDRPAEKMYQVESVWCMQYLWGYVTKLYMCMVVLLIATRRGDNIMAIAYRAAVRHSGPAIKLQLQRV